MSIMSLDKSFFEENRVKIAKETGDNTALVLFAGENDRMSADTEYRFLVDRNFYYLTGIECSSCIFVMIKREGQLKVRLYVPEKDEIKERWHGKRMSFEQYSEISGIPKENIRDLGTFDDALYKILQDKTLGILYDSSSVKACNRNFVTEALKSRTSEELTDIKDLFVRARMVKRPCEIEAIRRAAKVTEDAVEEVRCFIRPGMTEKEIYARLEYELERRGNMIRAFETIVAVDDNVFYLHHSDPDDTVVKEGDVIQLDLGSRDSGYCADISRALFVGESDDVLREQRKLALLGLIKSLRARAFEFIAPGITFDELNKEMRKICSVWLKNEGLIQMSHEDEGFDDKIISNYYWHNTSHHLGLDVHDVNVKGEPFVEGNCLAVEPGVYIKEWGIGFRIEDDVLVTGSGCELLSSGNDDLEVLRVVFT